MEARFSGSGLVCQPSVVHEVSGPEPVPPFLSAGPPAWPGAAFVAQLQEALRAGHLAYARDPIVGVGDDGAFPAPALLGHPGPPLVVDANWLRNDLLYACLHQQQTVMLTAANHGLVRLYCAPHVLDEVDEHHAEWAGTKSLTAAEVFEAWRRDYLPLLRRVTPPTGLLTAPEQARIDLLERRDADDVPSATLALLLQAAFISTDRHATRAVYGPEAAVRRQNELLQLMSAVGDTVQLRELGTVTTLLPTASGLALLRGAASAAKAAPTATLLAAAVLSVGLTKFVPEERWRGLRWAVGRGIELGAAAVTVHRDWQKSLTAATPNEPHWEELFSRVSVDLALARALMRTLAHGPSNQMTVTDLVAALPPFPVAQSERLARHALRSHRPAVFREVRRGHWQLGCSPARPTPLPV